MAPSGLRVHILNFPSFWEGLSLRHRPGGGDELSQTGHFPSFLEGLSLRHRIWTDHLSQGVLISLPFWKGFH